MLELPRAMVDFIEFEDANEAVEYLKETDGAQVMLDTIFYITFSGRVLRKGYPSFSVKALG